MGYRRRLIKDIERTIESYRSLWMEGTRKEIAAALGAKVARRWARRAKEEANKDLYDFMNTAKAVLSKVKPRSKREIQAWRAWVADELFHLSDPTDRPRQLTSAPPIGEPKAFNAWWRVNRETVKRLLG